MAADDGTGGLRERDHAGRTFEQFEPSRDLRVLHRKALGRERFVGFGAQFVADAVQPGFEPGGTIAAVRAGLEVRMRLARSPQARDLRIVEMTAAETVKK
jgi:hypothetical protein